MTRIPTSPPRSEPAEFAFNAVAPWQMGVILSRRVKVLLRPVTSPPMFFPGANRWRVLGVRDQQEDGPTLAFPPRACPLGRPGDTVFIREAVASRWDIDRALAANPTSVETLGRARHYVYYKADATGFRPNDPDNYHPYGRGWRPAKHMPRWAARAYFRVTSVALTRLREFTSEERAAELGITGWSKDRALYKYAPCDVEGDAPAWPWTDVPRDPLAALARAWDEQNSRHPFALDQWVWAVGVERAPDPVTAAYRDEPDPRAQPGPAGLRRPNAR